MRAISLFGIDIQKALKLAVALLALLFLWSLYHRFLFIDDGWLGEQANSLAQYGVVEIKLFKLYYAQFGSGDTPLYIYHKLFIALGGLLIYLTGSSNPYLLKSISLAAYLLLIAVIFYNYRNRFPNSVTSSAILLFYFLVLTNLIWISFIYRPEIVVTLFGYLSFRSISLGQGKKAFFSAGLLAGTAALFHLNGLIFILSGMAYTALNYRNFKSVFRFGLGASICLLYFADIAYHGAYAIWWQQFKVNPAAVYSMFNRCAFSRPIFMLFTKLNKLFFASVRGWAYSIPAVLSLLFLWINRTPAFQKPRGITRLQARTSRF